jgi:hypothetical protein
LIDNIRCPGRRVGSVIVNAYISGQIWLLGVCVIIISKIGIFSSNNQYISLTVNHFSNLFRSVLRVLEIVIR